MNGAEAGLPAFRSWAERPPMGWNSWDCFATTVTEEQVMAQAAFMAGKLKRFGWEYIVVDIQWYEPGANGFAYRAGAELVLDRYGRPLPAPNRFPSASGGAGFKPLADRVHAFGLKFGVHLMRGIPRQAVRLGLPILGTERRAGDIADQVNVCPWNPDNYGVDMAKPGAQEYYDSVFALLSEWGVDYVKVDDLSRPYLRNIPEIEAIRRAIDKTGRRMVLSLSPGATDIRAAEHVATHANLWRISDDFWDRWLALREQFRRLALWNDRRAAGAWPDADMLPLGRICLGERRTRFSPDEQRTMMTLWCVARSPLMHGGDLSKTDDFTLSLLANEEVLAVNQESRDNRPLFEKDGIVAWTARAADSEDRYLALFNVRDRVPIDESAASQAALLSTEPGNGAEIDVDISGGKSLFLAALPASIEDGSAPVCWASPRFVFSDDSERPLSEYAWTRADAQWDSASVSEAGLRAMAAAVIEYAIPPGAARLRSSVSAERPTGAERDSALRILTVIGTETNEDRREAVPAAVDLSELGLSGRAAVRDLWARADLGIAERTLAAEIPFHGARLFRLSPRA